MSFIAKKILSNKLSYLIGFFPIIPTIPFAKSLKPHTLLRFDLVKEENDDSDESANIIKSLLETDTNIESAYNKIKNWKKTKGDCSISFSINGEDSGLIELDDEIFKRRDALVIFTSESKLGNKSKFEKFVDTVVEEDNDYVLLRTMTEIKCGTKTLKLFWRDSYKKGDNNSFSSLKNYWMYDEIKKSK